MLALVDDVPRTLSLDAFIRHWTTHQIDVVRRRTAHLLLKAREAIHIYEGYLKALDALDEDALIKILTEPRNSLVKQYTRIFEMDDTLLEFKEDALAAIAAKAIERKSGARGLRAILEETMMDIMYEAPSATNIEKCVITKETVNDKKPPELILNENRKPLRKSGGVKKNRSKKESAS